MPDPFTIALSLLSARELSEAQLRARLERRAIEATAVDAVIVRLKRDGTLNDRRVALAIARMESTIKHRGRARVLQKIRRAGIDDGTAQDAAREVFAEVDEDTLLDRAVARRLRGQETRDLDDRGRARIIRGLIAQGFALDSILKKLKN